MREPENLDRGIWRSSVRWPGRVVNGYFSVAGSRWCEIDFIQDLQKAEKFAFKVQKRMLQINPRSDQLLRVPG
ncbi:MAG: hypothetical protein P0107_00055 [Nitrosomonas sp.]|nr:hypothetical protein [Nitrosomonas sp.]